VVSPKESSQEAGILSVILPVFHPVSLGKRSKPVEDGDQPLAELPVIDEFVLEMAKPDGGILIQPGSVHGEEKLPEYGAAEAFRSKGAEVPIAELRGCFDPCLISRCRGEDGLDLAHAESTGQFLVDSLATLSAALDIQGTKIQALVGDEAHPDFFQALRDEVVAGDGDGAVDDLLEA
jgi:hypothetical protein